MNNTSHRDGLRCVRAAHVALGWVVVFVGFHIYWYLGGSFGSPGRLPGWPHSLIGWTFSVLVDGAFALGLLVPWAISRGRALGRLAQPIGALAWLGGMVLLLRGSTGLVDDLTRVTGILPNGISGLSTQETTGTTDPHVLWSGVAIDAYFLAGGMIFTWLAIRHRQYRQSSRLSDLATPAAPVSPRHRPQPRSPLAYLATCCASPIWTERTTLPRRARSRR